MRLELIPDSASRTPVFAPAHYAEGFALLNSRRFREAMEQFRTALGTDPLLSDRARLNPDVRAGAAAMRENRTAAAIQHLEAAVAALTESSEAHRLLGLAYRAGARPQDGIRHLRNAVRLAPHDERAGVALGASAHGGGQPVGRRACLASDHRGGASVRRCALVAGSRLRSAEPWPLTLSQRSRRWWRFPSSPGRRQSTGELPSSRTVIRSTNRSSPRWRSARGCCRTSPGSQGSRVRLPPYRAC